MSQPPPRVGCRSYTAHMGATGVPQDAITEAADAVAEKIDVLLERATDAVLGGPRPGSEQWRQAWDTRDTAAGRAALEHRTRVKIAIAEAAGVDPRHEIERARRAGLLAPPSRSAEVVESPRRTRRRRGPAAGGATSACHQLAIW